MKSIPSIRSWLKWGGIVITLILLVLWPWNRKNAAAWNGSYHWLIVHHGGIELDYHAQGTPASRLPGLHMGRMEVPLWWMPKGEMQPNASIFIPFWLSGSITLLITAAAWWPDLRTLAGLCPHCRYDLAGLKPGTLCPECGKLPTANANPDAPHKNRSQRLCRHTSS